MREGGAYGEFVPPTIGFCKEELRMKKRAVIAGLAMAFVVAGCGYSLPPPLQDQVNTLTKQADGLYNAVKMVKRGAADGSVSQSALANVQKTYNELVDAHDDWRDEVQNVIAKEMDNFENDAAYVNSVRKLENASTAFEKAANAAMKDSPTEVPDWMVESTELIELAYNERKLKRAADLIHEDLRMLRWDEIKT